MAASSDEIFDALRKVKFPGFSRDIVSFGVVQKVEVLDGHTIVTLAPPAGTPDLVDKITPEIEAIVASLPPDARRLNGRDAVASMDDGAMMEPPSTSVSPPRIVVPPAARIWSTCSTSVTSCCFNLLTAGLVLAASAFATLASSRAAAAAAASIAARRLKCSLSSLRRRVSC